MLGSKVFSITIESQPDYFGIHQKVIKIAIYFQWCVDFLDFIEKKNFGEEPRYQVYLNICVISQGCNIDLIDNLTKNIYIYTHLYITCIYNWITLLYTWN